MVCRIASVAEEEDILPLAGVAHGAGVRDFLGFVLGIFSKPLAGIKLGDLFLILDLDAFKSRACVKLNS